MPRINLEQGLPKYEDTDYGTTDLAKEDQEAMEQEAPHFAIKKKGLAAPNKRRPRNERISSRNES